jgi:hypothetical protein
MMATSWTRGLLVLSLGGLLIAGCAAGLAAKNETPGQRFDREMKVFAKNCAKAKLKPNDTACDILKLKPADPLATEEGRFAHSIKIPNPVPEDSGYKPGMTSQEYFDHLCKTEAGEFTYKTVENVEGLYMMRPRGKANYEYSHLYAFEDPFGFEASKGFFVGPGGYAYFEVPALPSTSEELKYTRYFGYDGHRIETLQSANDAHRKSRYGYIWRGIFRPHDRELGIGGGEIIVLDLDTKEVLGVHRGYAKFEIDEKFGLGNAGWRKRCPSIHATGGPYGHFILKVLKPGSASTPAEGGKNATN